MMSENRYFDEFVNRIDESKFNINDEMKQKILLKTNRKIKSRLFSLKNIAAACAAIAVITVTIPNTPVNALCQKIFSFIPGIGVVQNDSDTNTVKSVLEKQVRVNDGNKFIEVKSCYIVNKTLNISIKTNAGLPDSINHMDKEEIMKFASGDNSPKLYLINGDKKVKANSAIQGGPSFETGAYSLNASFNLESSDVQNRDFKFELDSFNRIVEISMLPAKSSTAAEDMGNAAVIDGITVFANVSREKDSLEVLLSASAPKEYKNIRFYLFDIEKKVFDKGVYIVDNGGNVYKPDDLKREQSGGNIGTFYFNIPQDKNGLKIIIPQIFYNREYKGNIKLRMPKTGKEAIINKEISLGQNIITIEKSSIISANDPLLPDDFKAANCLKIDASSKPNKNSREMVCRIIPDIRVPDKFTDYISPSSGSYCELWDRGKRTGYSITTFDDINKTKDILLNFDAECALSGPIEIDIQ